MSHMGALVNTNEQLDKVQSQETFFSHSHAIII